MIREWVFFRQHTVELFLRNVFDHLLLHCVSPYFVHSSLFSADVYLYLIRRWCGMW
jgi:hypothetical protein